jgi:hypothetical protein
MVIKMCEKSLLIHYKQKLFKNIQNLIHTCRKVYKSIEKNFTRFRCGLDT